MTSSLRPEPWFPDPAAPLGSRTPHTPIHPAADSASASVCSRREVPFPRQVGVSTTEGAGCGAWSGGAREGMTALLPPGWAWALGAESLGTLRLSAPPLPPRPGPAPAGSRRPSTPALAAHLASRSLRRPTDPLRRPRGPSAPHVSHPLTPLVPTQTGRPASLSESLILSRVYGGLRWSHPGLEGAGNRFHVNAGAGEVKALESWPREEGRVGGVQPGPWLQTSPAPRMNLTALCGSFLYPRGWFEDCSPLW